VEIEILPWVTLMLYQNIVLPSQMDTWPAWQKAKMKSRHIFLQESTKKPMFVVVLNSI